MCAAASGSVTKLVRICIGGKGLPERAQWAAGMWVTFPAALAECVASASFDEPETRALAGLAARGVAVPADFSIVGCDDVLGAMTYPPLSSVSNACPEAGRVAVSLLMDMLKTRVVRDVRYVLGTSLVIRKTTGAADKT